MSDQTDRNLARSPELMNHDDTGLLVVDVQEKLIQLIRGHQLLVWNIGRLIDAARILGVVTAATEQYPQGLGPTTAELAERLPARAEKRMFSCIECSQLIQQFRDRGIHKILVAGIETHVCIQQTVLDLLGEGFRVYLAADATGTRYEVDHQIALRRMESSGAMLTTTEAAIFEWCQTSAAAQFKQISALVRLTPPSR